MRKIIKIFITIFIINYFIFPIYGAESDVLESQKENLNISEFINKAKDYTQDTFGDNVKIDEILESALTGKIDNNSIYISVLNLFGKELKHSLKTFGAILVVIVVHSVLKSISDGLGNKSVSQITYYAQYILIVTLVMTNFSEIIVIVKDSIGDLVGFTNCLVPILITLMITTRKHCFSKLNTTNFIIFNNFYRKRNSKHTLANNTCINCIRHCFKNIGQVSNFSNIKIL